jgi:hypothetical protein
LNPFKLEFKKALVVESNLEGILKLELCSNWKISVIKRLEIRLKLLKITTNIFRMFFKNAEIIFSCAILSFSKNIISKSFPNLLDEVI